MKTIFLLARVAACIVPAFYLSSCQNLEENSPMNAEQAARSQQVTNEVAYPGETGTTKEGTLFGQKISYQEINNQYVYQGDIILSPEQLNAAGSANARTEATGTSKAIAHWPGGIVWYNISSSIADKSAITAAIAEIESKTSVKFMLRLSQPNYVTFATGRGYSSSLGMIGGQQYINVGLRPAKGSVLHEIAHTLGMLHEHTRLDREGTIKIKYANLNQNSLLEFAPYTTQGLPGLDFKTFDLGSIMMVDAYTSSANGQPTITLLNNQTYSIQRSALSAKDAECINAMYASVYLIGNGKLTAEDNVLPRSVVINEQAAASWAAVSDDNYVYTSTTAGSLLRYHKITGEKLTLISNNFVTRAIALYKGYLYAISGGYLMRIDPATGASATVGGKVWFEATAMTYVNGFLYLVNGNNLFRIDPQSGISVNLASGFYNCRELSGRDKKVWALLGSSLFSIDWMTGATTKLQVNKTFSWDAQVTTFGNNLFVVETGTLYRISMSTGQISTISSGWTYVNQLTANDYID